MGIGAASSCGGRLTCADERTDTSGSRPAGARTPSGQMSELILDRDRRLALRAGAHHLRPVVLLGSAGLTEAVVKETDRALAAHELIKVRIPSDARDEREQIYAELAARLGAARIQAIGKLVVLYRPRPQEEPVAAAKAAARPAARPATASAPKRQPAPAAQGRSAPAAKRRSAGRQT